MKARAALLFALAISIALPAGAKPEASCFEAGAPAVELPEHPGRALRLGLEVEAVGDLARASALFRGVAQREPLVADYARLAEARALLAADCAEAALAAARAGVESAAGRRSLPALQRTLGDAYQALGREGEARQAWEAGIEATRDEALEAALLDAIAASWERTGQLEQAAGSYLRLWTRHPTSDAGRTADARLPELEARLAHSVRDAADWRRRAGSLAREGRNEEALFAYDRALAQLPDGNERERTRLAERRAHTLFRLRRYGEAERAFAALAGDDLEAALWRSRAAARSGDVPRAARELEALAQVAPRGLADRARLIAALLLADEKPEDQVRSELLLTELAEESPSDDLARTALWNLAWTAYRGERFERSAELLARLEHKEDDPIARLQPRYWAARAAARLGPAREREALASLASDWPLSYYGWRARSRLERTEAAPAAPTTAPREIPEGASRIKPAEFERPRILLEAGLEAEAASALDALAPRARSLDDRLDLARLYADARQHDRSRRLLIDAYAEVLAGGPIPGHEELWRLAYPRAYAEVVENGGAPHDVEPALVWAVMREESGFQADATSFAGARGLLQIMPETGAKLASDAGLAGFDPEDLFQPDVNIRLGALYLRQLQERFPGRFSATIGSYNAGPSAVSRWIEERSGLDDDEWVESIPYSQTRTYVKRVLRSWHAYRTLY